LSFGGGSEKSDFLVERGPTDDFGDESWMLFDGDMLDESVVIDKERAGLRVFFSRYSGTYHQLLKLEVDFSMELSIFQGKCSTKH